MIFLLFLLTALMPALIPYPFPQRNKEFSPETITANLPFHPEWETRTLNPEEKKEVEAALSQSFRYLGGGGQCFCFVSGDGKYVIKFFKQKAFAPPLWMDHFAIPSLIQPLREKKIAKRLAKRSRVFEACRLSFDNLAEETGLLYVHLNPTHHLQKQVAFRDESGKEHALNMNHLEFVIQRKGELASEVLDKYMRNHEIEKAKFAIDQLLSLHLKFFQKGFFNRDPNFRGNYGFLEGRPFEIDVGRIVEMKGEKIDPKDLSHTTRKFREYLSSKHPELVSYFDESLTRLESAL